jgi:peptide/nickel transport system substrate-binding protein
LRSPLHGRIVVGVAIDNPNGSSGTLLERFVLEGMRALEDGAAIIGQRGESAMTDGMGKPAGDGRTIGRRTVLAGAAAAAGLAAGSRLLSPLPAKAQEPRRGGRLRVGARGAGTDEVLDPHTSSGEVSIARNHNHFELLFDFGPDGAPYPVLAEEMTPNAEATVWKIRVRDGVLFHNGKPLTAADVVYSYRRIKEPGAGREGANDLAFVDPDNIRALDDTTVELTLNQPIGNLMDNLASRSLSIVPDGWTDFANPVGTGPFKFVSFTPGQRSLSARWDEYWRSGMPYLDELEFIAVDDNAARVNALLAGQIDVAGTLDYAQVAAVEAAGFKILNSETGGFQANLMCITQPPFDDVRVRRAIRLLHDRQQLVDTIYFGYGVVGNDLGMRFDPIYASEIPQMQYDPDQARSLLRAAGQEDLTLSIFTSTAFPGMLESATLLKEQARAAGVTINLNQMAADAYYGDTWLADPFKQTLWGQRSQDLFILQALDSNAPYNETCWFRPEFDALTREARATVDATRRRELYVEAQKIMWEETGYAIWGHGNYIDGLGAKVAGFTPSPVRWMGHSNFKEVYFEA